VKPDDLEVSGETELSGGLQLKLGKMKEETAVRVNRCIIESSEYSKQCSDWRWHVLRQDNTRNDDEPEKITEATKLLQWFQSLVVPVQARVITHNSKLMNFGTSKMQERETRRAAPGCCPCWSKWFGDGRLFGDSRQEGKHDKSMGSKIDRVDLLLVGYSDNVEIQVVPSLPSGRLDSLKSEKHFKGGQYLPRFEIKFLSEIKGKSEDCTYQGLYCWPAKGNNGSDLYLGEFRDGTCELVQSCLILGRILILDFFAGRFDGYGAVFYFDGGFYKCVSAHMH
jgi:hypothetical protein